MKPGRRLRWAAPAALLLLATSVDTVAESTGHFVSHDGTRLFYRVLGEGKQSVVIPLDLFLSELLRPLATGRRLIFYDPRGRGRSDRVPAERATFDRQIADLDAVRRHFGLERMTVIGWSGLGMEAAVYAMRHPGRVERLVQVAPVPPRRDPWIDRMIEGRRSRSDAGLLASIEKRHAAGEFRKDPASYCRELNRATAGANFADPKLAALKPDVCGHANEWPGNLGPFFEAFLGSLGRFDWRAELGKLPMPRLVIHGEQDTIPLEGNLEWVRGQSNARILVISGAAHWPGLERPEAFFPAVERFLSGEWPERSQAIPAIVLTPSPADRGPRQEKSG
jgi:proline iminopeptidase